MTAARPPGLSSRRNKRQKQQFGLLGLDDLQQVLGGVLVIERPGKGRIGEHQRVALLLAGVVLRQRVAVADVRVLDAVQQHVHAADAQHGVVEVEAVEHAVVKMLAQFRLAQHFSGCCSRRYSPAATRKPQVPHAGSQMMSFGLGAVISTMSG